MILPTISKASPLILASSSPRRKRLLEQIGLPFRSVPSKVAEKRITEDPSANARLLAERKARAVLYESHNNWILGADTMVVLGERILGKPEDHDDAQSMLLQLSAKEHRVITGFCLLDPSSKMAYAEAITTLVKMKPLSEEEISAYIATGEPFGKAGSYAIQGIGSFLVEAISGSYTNVVGLPVCALIKALLATGALEIFPLAS
ncbi:MAG: Maf family protein [Desulfobacteraceae bacterium]|jgi:septum formation protein